MTTALRQMRKTVPVSVAYAFATDMGADVDHRIGGFWDVETQLSAASNDAMAGFGLTAAMQYLLSEQMQYIVNAGHIIVMVRARRRNFPAGQG